MENEVQNHSNPGEKANWQSDGSLDRAPYRIVVRGCLDTSWSEWFDGLDVAADPEQGETTITGSVADQAALHGLLNKVRNLGLTLVCVSRLEATVVESGDDLRRQQQSQ
jgi:hypothetical protein